MSTNLLLNGQYMQCIVYNYVFKYVFTYNSCLYISSTYEIYLSLNKIRACVYQIAITRSGVSNAPYSLSRESGESKLWTTCTTIGPVVIKIWTLKFLKKKTLPLWRLVTNSGDRFGKLRNTRKRKSQKNRFFFLMYIMRNMYSIILWY